MPQQFDPEPESAYREMAADDSRETEALEWSEGLLPDIEDDSP